MKFGTIFSIAITIATNAPKAWAIIEAGIAAFENATDAKAKLAAVSDAIENALEEIKTVVASL